MNNPDFSERFGKMARNVPDLERLISRIHAGRCKQSDFLKVVDAFERIATGFMRLGEIANGFEGTSVGHLIKSCPDLTPFMNALRAMYTLTDGGKIRL
jgi:DNA mismatch repair protein MSH6